MSLCLLFHRDGERSAVSMKVATAFIDCWLALSVFRVFLSTHLVVSRFYGSRTHRSKSFTAYQRRQRSLDTCVNRFAPDPRTIVVWGANFFGEKAVTGEQGLPPSRALCRQFAVRRRVVLVNEYHTSKHSCCCGTPVRFLANRVVQCTECEQKHDRDVNGAKNIKRVWEQHLIDGGRPAGLEYDEGTVWSNLRHVLEHAGHYSQLPFCRQAPK